ncbi:MAG: alginate lyase family protein [Geminicoccaceae bacterium]
MGKRLQRRDLLLVLMAAAVPDRGMALPPPRLPAVDRLPLPGTIFPAPRQAAALRVALHLQPAPAAVLDIAPEDDNGSDRRVEPMTWYVMTGIAAHLAGGDAGPAVLAALAAWARAGALERLEPAGPKGSLVRARYTLKRSLLPLLAAYAVLRRDLPVPPAEAEIIEAWLGRLVLLAEPADGPVSARNNHRYMRDVVMLAWASLQGDVAAFRTALADCIAAIGAQRPDGAWPLELDRGPRALWYQRHAIASLVAAAEIAAAQGVDLYAVDLDGRSLHAAIAFLLDGIDAAARGRMPGQDLGFLERRGNGRHYMAWADAYAARFPDHPNARRLRALLAGAPRPLLDDYSGGDVIALAGARPAPGSGEV